MMLRYPMNLLKFEAADSALTHCSPDLFPCERVGSGHERLKVTGYIHDHVTPVHVHIYIKLQTYYQCYQERIRMAAGVRACNYKI